MKNLTIDVFCGSGSFGKVVRSFGYEVISLDNRRRAGVCEPTIKTDILKVPSSFFKSMNPKIMWFGLPCDIWSLASGGFHLDKNFNPKTEKAKIHLEILKKTMSIIEETDPDFFFIENPRGKLNKYPGLNDFLLRTDSVIKECTLSSYGFPTKKPTIIITNFKELQLKDLDTFGRGAKNKVHRAFDNLTKVQRQQTPQKLIRDIVNQVQKYQALYDKTPSSLTRNYPDHKEKSMLHFN